MPGRKLLTEADWIPTHFGANDPAMIRRREVIHETVERFDNGQRIPHYQSLAQQNLAAWSAASQPHTQQHVRVKEGDWGVVTQALTIEFGQCFAVLNMANPFIPGGAYVEGAPAQEENIFRRTDCHFSIGPDEYDEVQDCYHYPMTRLLLAEQGEVYLDAANPRTCIRGPEDRDRSDLGYAWLDDNQVFPFFELRAAAQDLRDGSYFSTAEAEKRIAAQLDTLIKHNIRHAVLGAHGCGAFMNPTQEVAWIYHEQINRRSESFSVIAFAIFNAGYGPDNFTPFARQFSETILLGS